MWPKRPKPITRTRASASSITSCSGSRGAVAGAGGRVRLRAPAGGPGARPRRRAVRAARHRARGHHHAVEPGRAEQTEEPGDQRDLDQDRPQRGEEQAEPVLHLLLAESNFRHQLEADIEPFRGMLLGLFFMSVGMSIDPTSSIRSAVPSTTRRAAAVITSRAPLAAKSRKNGPPAAPAR
jgi:hypothetical protein